MIKIYASIIYIDFYHLKMILWGIIILKYKLKMSDIHHSQYKELRKILIFRKGKSNSSNLQMFYEAQRSIKQAGVNLPNFLGLANLFL